MKLKITRHALSRCDERAIPVTALDLIVRYGADAPAARGAIQLRFDEYATQSARTDGISIKALRHLHGVVLIVDGNIAVTVWRDRSKQSLPRRPKHGLQSHARRLHRHDIGTLALDEMEATL